MAVMRVAPPCWILSILFLSSLVRGAEPPALEIVRRDCLSCHGPEKKRGQLDLSRRESALAGGETGPAFVPGKPDLSLLLNKVSKGEMPPKKRLDASQVEVLRRWIENGASYPAQPLTAQGDSWWSFQPLRSAAPPPVVNRGWIKNPIDCFILARLEEKNLQPAAETGRTSWLRRVSFDLVGLPPTPEELEAFQKDNRPDAYERQVDRLLASPRYGERWARHWLDVVRFAESHGYETNLLRPNAWPYRDYVIRAFNHDIPYPQFVLEQLAGDSLAGADPLSQAATGFLVAGSHDVVGNQTTEGKEQQRQDDLDDVVANTGMTFLGLTIGCSRCHDHKFDPIPQRDYYRLQAVFAGLQHEDREIPTADKTEREREAALVRAEIAELEMAMDRRAPRADTHSKSPRRPPVNARRNIEAFAPVLARKVRFVVEKTTDTLEPCIDELEIFTAASGSANIALASAGALATASSTLPNSKIHRLEHLNDGRYGNGRSWISNQPGKGWVQVKLAHPERIERIVWGRDRDGVYKDRLAVDYRIEVETESGDWIAVATSSDRAPPGSGAATQIEGASDIARRTELQERLAYLTSAGRVYAGRFAKAEPTYTRVRGDPMRKGERVTPGAPSALRPGLDLPGETEEQERRQKLARWLCEAENPLTARVLVNRLWQYHFGVGLSSTPSDFGHNGESPSHPELLDWMAAECIRQGWRLKPLHRLIVLSATYRQSSEINATAQAIDRQNRLLSRQNPRRLEAESLRDAVLAVSGMLNQRMGGPGYNIWEKNTNYVVVFKSKAKLGNEEFRRMVYQFKPRTQQDPVFGIFDCPDGALARPRRTTSTTALQALNLLNSSFMEEQAHHFAARLERDAGRDVCAQVKSAFRIALGREPSSLETSQGLSLVQAHGLAALCRALFNANEFVYAD